jgi:hypothetical protein
MPPHYEPPADYANNPAMHPYTNPQINRPN